MRDPAPPYLELLLEKSFEIIPGEFYNQYRLEVAERVGDSYLFYEFSLMEEKPWRILRERVYPLFVRYMKAKLIDPTTASGVVVAVFHGDKCYLMKGEDFLAAYREIEGIDHSAFHARVQKWLSV
ncbi:MAG: hypothetical protein LJE89_00780 [Deltaproteobacteria bacterium]|nr:hypothetical protein [Deltaproteobacteria bacterium]